MVVNKQAIKPAGRAESGLPYSPGIRANGFVFTAGQVSADPKSGEIVGEGDVRSQTRQTLENVRQVLEAAGSSMAKIVKTTVFLSDIRFFAAMNEVYREMMPEPRPARSTVQAPLADARLLVEIEAIALE